MSMLSPVPYRTPMIDRNGLIDRNWQQFFQALLERVGGVGDVSPNNELEQSVTTDVGNESLALIVQTQRMLSDLEALQAFDGLVAQTTQETESLDIFQGLSQADLQNLREHITNIEAVQAFAL